MVRLGLVLTLALTGACGRHGFAETEAVMGDASACSLVVEVGAARINVNSHRTIGASGGRAPLVFSVDSTLAQIDASTGELSAYSRAGTVLVAVSDADGCVATAPLAIGGDTVWYVGGTSNSVPQSSVLRSTDGTSWSVAGQLPGARQYGALVTFRDRLWWFSGSDGIGVRDEIYVSDDGETWSLAGNVPTAASNFGFTVFQDQLWFVGGNSNANRVYRSDDAVTWTLAGTLPLNNHGGSLSSLGDRLIYTGGHDGSLFDWVVTSTDGATWLLVGTLAVPREYHSSIVIDGRLYIVGGQNTVPTALTSVASTADGETWSIEPDLPAGRAYAPLVYFKDQLWSIGGTDMGGPVRSSPGDAWSTVVSTFPIPRQGGSAVRFTPAN